MSEREQFEAWYKKYDRDTQRQYWTRESACWHAWQAARAQPAPITSENGNQAAQGASAITSVPLLSEQEIVKCLTASGCVGTVKMSYDSGPYEITRTSVNADRFARAIESLVRSKLREKGVK